MIISKHKDLKNRDSDQDWKNLEILHFSLVIPVTMLLALIILPWEFSWVFMVGFLLFHLHVCFALTFDGFTRFSRYRLSQKNPIWDKIVSIGFIALCFLGLSPFVLLLKAYSLRVSPDNKALNILSFYERPFFIPLVQAIALLCAFGVFLLK